MGVYYSGGVVYGYKVQIVDLYDRFGFDDPAYDAANHYGVDWAREGNFYAKEGASEVVFRTKGTENYISADSSSDGFGFKGVNELDTALDGNMEVLMTELDGELGIFAFASVT